jgi:sensor histidine kinase regulating citrate/malate metabolism
MVLEDAAIVALVFVIAALVMKNIYDEKERAALAARSEVLYDYITKSQDLRDETHKLRHDTQNQLLTVKTLLDEGETDKAADMAEKLSGAVTVLPRVDYCENTLVNAVLANKEPLCREAGIETEYSLNLPPEIGVADEDLVSALANLLDNAIKACRKLPEGAEKRIALTAEKKDDILLLRCLNSADPEEKRELSRLKKPGKDGHGWGLRILRDMAKRYDGSFKMTDAGSTVDAVLMLKEKALS